MVSFAELRLAMPLHADALRAFWRVMGKLDLPDHVYTDPQVVRRTRELLGSAAKIPVTPQPTTADIDAALSRAAPPT